MVAGARAKTPAHVIALDMAPQKLELAKECGADIVINIASEDAVAQVIDVTDGYGADVYLEGTGHPSAVIQGLNLLRKLGTYVEYGVFGSDVTVDWSIISDDKELNVLGCAPRPVLLARSDPDDRVRSAADGQDLHPPTTARRVPERSRPRVQRHGVRQSLPDPLTGAARSCTGQLSWTSRSNRADGTRSGHHGKQGDPAQQ